MNGSSQTKQTNIQHYADGTASVMRKAVVYTELRFYQRSDVLYQLTQIFCQRYLPKYGDRRLLAALSRTSWRAVRMGGHQLKRN